MKPCTHAELKALSLSAQASLIKQAGLSSLKTYKCTKAPIEGPIVNVTIRCVFCQGKVNKDINWKSQCPVFFHLKESPTTPLKRDQIKEVIVMQTATITPPVKSGISVAHLLTLISIIEDMVIENEQMFTCWDVTKALKAKGFVVPHNQVRDFVHGLNTQGSVIFDAWTRNTHTFNLRSGSMTAEVYAPSWLNLSDYDPYAVSDGSTPATTPGVVRNPISGAIQPRNTIVPSTTQRNTGSTVAPVVAKSVQKRVAIQTAAKGNRTSRDARGRLCVPNAMVRKLGLSAGDIAYIHAAGFGLTVKASNLPGQKYLTSLKVDKDDNVRITRKALDKAGVARSEASLVVSIDTNGTSVVITR